MKFSIRERFPEEDWLSSLLLDEHRDIWANMTQEEKQLVRNAYWYGVANASQEKKV